MRGIIYSIKGGNECYYGSTTSTLARRKAGHTSDFRRGLKNCNSSILFNKYGIENCIFEVLEEIEFENKIELKTKERFYILNNECVNRIVPFNGTREEYQKQYEENRKGKRNDYRKEQHEKNKEKEKEQYKKYYIKNREKLIEKAKKWNIENKDKIKDQVI